VLVADGDGALAGLYVGDDARGAREGRPDRAPLAEAADQLEAWFAGERTTFDLPLALTGTPFQRAVWSALLEVPYGTTTTYTALAAAAGRPAAVRAAGAAHGRNPVSIVVPCHRVVGTDGRLRGYAGGTAAKARLLAHEQRFRTLDRARRS
jgi:methylated-DNA-[protein]-cysteine S-methyltransferase